jgi:hypothetical protein
MIVISTGGALLRRSGETPVFCPERHYCFEQKTGVSPLRRQRAPPSVEMTVFGVGREAATGA